MAEARSAISSTKSMIELPEKHSVDIAIFRITSSELPAIEFIKISYFNATKYLTCAIRMKINANNLDLLSKISDYPSDQ
ncbi:Interleukin-1 receptor type [Dirofilaria immitis]